MRNIFFGNSFLLAVLIPCCLGEYQNWAPSETFDSYVPFPPEIEPLLKNKTARLAPISPLVTVITTLPEIDDDHIWVYLEAPAIRNSYQNPIMTVQANFVFTDGHAHGCMVKKGSDYSTLVESEECLSHCTHRGRYCPIHTPEELHTKIAANGTEFIHEILLRLCIQKIKKTTDFKWFEYLRGFDKAKCWDREDLIDCSRQVMKDVKIDYHPFKGCVNQAELDSPTKNDMLEEQLEFIQNMPYKLDEMPILDIGGEKYAHPTGQAIRDDHILRWWCAHFPKDDRPVACDFCDKCNYQRKCLWSLQCDGIPFDPNNYKDPKTTDPPTLAPTMNSTQEPSNVEASSGVGITLGSAIIIGLVFSGLCYCLGEWRRKKAVAEVSRTLPSEGGYNDDGYKDKDEDNFKDEDDANAVELPVY